MATNNHQLMPKLLRSSKPSRWWQTPRVTRNPQPQRSPSATRCNHLSKCTRNHSQSHYDDESMMETSGRCLLRLTRMSSMSKYQESEPQAGQTLFIDTPNEIEPLCLKGCLCASIELTGRSDRTQPLQRLVARSLPHVTSFKPQPLDPNGQNSNDRTLSYDRM